MAEQKQYERQLVAILFLVWGIVFLDRMSVLFLAPFIVPELHLSNSQVGLLASVLSITWAFSGLLFGAMSDRYGRKRVFLPLLFVFAAASWCTGVARSFAQMLGLRALIGVDEGAVFTTLTATMEEASARERRGLNVGIVVSAAALISSGVGPVLLTQMAQRLGWRSAFLLSGVPMLILGLILAKVMKAPEARITHPPLSQYLSVFRYRNVLLSCIGSAGFMTWLWVMGAFAPLYITQVGKGSATLAGMVIGAGGVGGFVWALVAPGMSDRLGRKPMLVLIALLSAMVPLIYQVPFLQLHPALMALAGFVANGSQAIVALVLVLIPAESVPHELAGTAIGLSSLVGEVLGGTLAPAIAGAAADRFGLAAPLWIAAGGCFVVCLAALGIKETSPARGA